MTAPRPREQHCPPSPPDRRPPRRGGGSSPLTYAASAAGRPAGRRAGLVRSGWALVAVACLGLTGALALPVAAQTLSDDATLSALVVNDGSANLHMHPPLDPSNRFDDEYYVDVSHDVETVTVTGTPNHTGATVSYSPANPVSLRVGYQNIAINVTSEDGREEEKYKVGVFRAPPASPSCMLNSGDIWCSLVPISRSITGQLGASGGALSDFDFTYKTYTYRFRLIRVSSRGTLTVAFYPVNLLATRAARLALRDLYLQVGSAEFRFSDSLPGPTFLYQWANSGLGWSSGNTVTVRLREIPPEVVSVAVTSWPEAGGNVYRWGDTILFTLTFSEKVRVEGQPQPTLAFDLGGTEREARFWGLSDTDYVKDGQRPEPRPEAVKVHFGYTVQPGDFDSDGVEVGELSSALRLGGARILSAANNVEAEPSHAAVGPLTDHKVDGGTAEGPADAGVTIIDTDGNPLELRANGKYRLVIRESTRGRYGLKLNTRPTHTVDLSAIYSDGDEDLRVLPTYTPLPISPDKWETPMWVDIRAGRDDDNVDGERVFQNRVHSTDPAYNDLILPDVLVVENDDIALLGRFVSPPERHDGTKRIKVRVAFSEPVEESPQAVGEHGVEVKGGEVTSVSPVGGNALDGAGTRSVGGRNAGQQDREVVWEFQIEPDSDGDVTVSLEAWRPCDEAGAICTADGRELSEGISTTVEGPHTGPPPLTAAFENVPAAHDGSAFTFRMAFSEDIGISYRSLREDAFTVTGGRVTRGRRVDDRRDLFEMTVAPDSDDDVTIELPAGRDCATSGAICTKGENRRQLTNTPTATVAGPADEGPEPNTAATGAPTISGTPRVGEELTASTSDISDADGLENAGFAYQWIRGSGDIGRATGSSYTAVDADEGQRLKVRVSFTDDAGNEESVTSRATDAVAAAAEPLTAGFSSMPGEHRGEGDFKFRVQFSDEIKISYKTMRDRSFRVTNADITGARRVDGRRDLWEMTVEPDSHQAVTIRLPKTTGCDATGAVCTSDGRPLSHSLRATVRGPVGISVADARVDENKGAALAFAVTLTRAASETLTVDYATENGSATAGDDYTAASGTLTFRSGQSSKTIEVGVLDDSHDEGEETLTLRLSNASGGRVADGEATGTIVNRDPLPRALLARFGRTAAVHVVEHVEERMEAPREPGFRGEVAGRELRRDMGRDMALNLLRQLGGRGGVHGGGTGMHGQMAGAPHGGAEALGAPGLGASGQGSFATPGPGGGVGMGMAAATAPMGGGMAPGAIGAGAGPGAMPAGAGPRRGPGPLDMGLRWMGFGGDSLLTGSSFALNRETSRGGILSFWSRGARSSFQGREGALSLGGDVRTTMFGADYAKGPLVVGLSLARSQGLGNYAGKDSGQVASAVTGLYPWLGYKLNERVSVWGVTGYGTGGLLLTPQGGPALESGLSMKMSAAGTRGELVPGGEDGFGLAFKADALWVGTATDGVDGPAGRMAATAAAVSRVRTALEGSRGFTFGRGLSLKPSIEVGVRHDAGDAEQGSGMDVGGGLVVSDAATGLAVDVRVRMLLVHEAEDFRERGVSVSLSYNPTPQTPLGFTAWVAPSWGGQATSGAQALWGRDTMAGMANGGIATGGNRVDADLGYGLPVGSRFVGTPRVGFATSEYGRDYRVGYALGLLESQSLNFELGVDAQRRENPMLGGAEKGILGRATLGW